MVTFMRVGSTRLALDLRHGRGVLVDELGDAEYVIAREAHCMPVLWQDGEVTFFRRSGGWLRFFRAVVPPHGTV